MRRSLWRSWLPFLLLTLAVLFLVFHETRILAPVESALQVVVAPLQRGGSRLVENIGDLFQTVRELRELRTEVELLREQVDTLTIENVRLREFEAEAIQLRELNHFVSANPTWGFVGVDVIGQSACIASPCGKVLGEEPNPYLRYLSINTGAEEGVMVGMPAVARGAVLVGRVAEVGLHTSRVQLLNDSGSGVAVLLQNSRATGLVVGQPDGSLRMTYVPHGEVVQVGDIVLTSGLGGVLPRGLIVGQVADVLQQDFALFQEAVIRPALDYRQVEMLLVVSSFQPLVQEEPDPVGEP
ncbi:MAG: rod shape-determining protein MreC [Anaerolineae bacterium]|nr:rod shape-determining protein MreC [Anaerolineae bacterium]